MQTVQHVAFAQHINIAADCLHGHVELLGKRTDGRGPLLKHKSRDRFASFLFFKRHRSPQQNPLCDAKRAKTTKQHFF